MSEFDETHLFDGRNPVERAKAVANTIDMDDVDAIELRIRYTGSTRPTDEQFDDEWPTRHEKEPDTERVKQLVSYPGKTRRLLEYIADNPGAASETITKETDINKRLLTTLARTRLVKRKTESTGESGWFYRYRITADGHDLLEQLREYETGSTVRNALQERGYTT